MANSLGPAEGDVDKRLEVFYYEIIRRFLAAHADKLEYVTKEWITSQKPPQFAANYVVPCVDAEYQQNLLEGAALRDRKSPDYINVRGVAVSVEKIFIFGRDDYEFAAEVT